MWATYNVTRSSPHKDDLKIYTYIDTNLNKTKNKTDFVNNKRFATELSEDITNNGECLVISLE